MAIQIALLRGINVGGRNLVAMSDLREMCEKLGFTQVQSILQSGNLVFQAAKPAGSALERLLEKETEKRLKASVHYVVRNAAEWKAIVAGNPFPKEAKSDPSHLVVMCLKDAVDAKLVKSLQSSVKGPEVIRADGRQLYITYPAGIGDSKLTNAVIEKAIGTPGTARNWNTVLKLAAMTMK